MTADLLSLLKSKARGAEGDGTLRLVGTPEIGTRLKRRRNVLAICQLSLVDRS